MTLIYILPPLLLVDCATQVIESIWPTPPPTAANVKLLSLNLFVQEVLRRSRTSYLTLQTALFYLDRVKRIRDRTAYSDVREHHSKRIERIVNVPVVVPTTTKPTGHIATPPESQVNSGASSTQMGCHDTVPKATGPLPMSVMETRGVSAKHSGKGAKHASSADPRQCGRRMFLASLVIATKYLQDRAYSNRAWSRVSGLSAAEITRCERKLLQWLEWNLYIAKDEFAEFQAELLARVQAAGAKTSPMHVVKPMHTSHHHGNYNGSSVPNRSSSGATGNYSTNMPHHTTTPMPTATDTTPTVNAVMRHHASSRPSISLGTNIAPIPSISQSILTMPTPSPSGKHYYPTSSIPIQANGVISPTTSPHAHMALAHHAGKSHSSHSYSTVSSLERKRPRPDSDACEHMSYGLVQRPRIASTVEAIRSVPSQ
jgi:hypothetical protein